MDALAGYEGLESAPETAAEPVERGAVRRFAQAIMDEDPRFWSGAGEADGPGPVAPPLFPIYAFRRSYGSRDVIDERGGDPGFDGLTEGITLGLPALEPLADMVMLNGGAEISLFSLARHGEWISRHSRYASIEQKATSKGPMVFVTTETDYRAGEGRPLLRVARTLIWR